MTHVRKAEIRTAREAALDSAMRMAERAGVHASVDADPIEHLLFALQVAFTLTLVWGAHVQALDASADPNTVRGTLGYIENPDLGELTCISNDPLLALDRQGAAQIHPFVNEYNLSLERHARFAKLCIDAGVAERQIRLAEQQGQLLAQVIRGVLTDLGVADRPDAPAVIRRHLALVSGGLSA